MYFKAYQSNKFELKLINYNTFDVKKNGVGILSQVKLNL